jgi:hypothetical protein
VVIVDPSKIKWRTVTYDEYLQDDKSPFRQTEFQDGEQETIYELGTLPQELPTKVGAIVAPRPGDEEYGGYNPYVRGKRGWYELTTFGSTLMLEDEDTVKSYLNDGWIVAFEGVED